MCARWASRSSGGASPGHDARVLKWLLVLVVAIVVIALCRPWLARLGLGRLPGDITVRWRGRPLYLPIATTVLLSLALTLLGRLL